MVGKVGFILIGTVYNGANMLGYKLFNTDDGNCILASKMDVDTKLKSGVVSVENLEVSNGTVKGSNGAISRYPRCDANNTPILAKEHSGKSPMVILGIYKGQGYNPKTLGYKVCDISGKIADLGADDAIKIFRSRGIANGKLTEISPGNFTVRPISGSYKTFQKVETRNNTQQSKSSTDANASHNKIQAQQTQTKTQTNTQTNVSKYFTIGETTKILDGLDTPTNTGKEFSGTDTGFKASKKQIIAISRFYADLLKHLDVGPTKIEITRDALNKEAGSLPNLVVPEIWIMPNIHEVYSDMMKFVASMVHTKPNEKEALGDWIEPHIKAFILNNIPFPQSMCVKYLDYISINRVKFLNILWKAKYGRDFTLDMCCGRENDYIAMYIAEPTLTELSHINLGISYKRILELLANMKLAEMFNVVAKKTKDILTREQQEALTKFITAEDTRLTVWFDSDSRLAIPEDLGMGAALVLLSWKRMNLIPYNDAIEVESMFGMLGEISDYAGYKLNSSKLNDIYHFIIKTI